MLHGFLSYLMRCTVTGEPYTVFGYDGKQVRDNIHSADLVRAFEAVPPRAAAGRRLQHRRRAATATARCSRRSRSASEIAGPRARLGAQRRSARIGDHRWWISDLVAVPGATIPTGEPSTTCEAILREIHDQNVERWSAAA